MTIAHDTATQAASYASTGTQTTSHAGSASAKGVVVLIEQNGSANDEVSGVTYGSVTMGEIRTDSESTEAGRVYIYFLANPPTGTQDVAMTTTGSTAKRLVVATLTATAGTPEVVGTGNTGTSNSASNPALSLTGLTASRNYQCYEVIHSGLQSMTTTPQTTPAWSLLYSNDNGSQGNGFARLNNTPAGTTIAGGWIAATADDYVISGVAIWENPNATVTATAVAVPGAAISTPTPSASVSFSAALAAAPGSAIHTPTISTGTNLVVRNFAANPTFRGSRTALDAWVSGTSYTVSIDATTGWTGAAPSVGDLVVVALAESTNSAVTPPAEFTYLGGEGASPRLLRIYRGIYDGSGTLDFIISASSASESGAIAYAFSTGVNLEADVVNALTSATGTGTGASLATPATDGLTRMDDELISVVLATATGAPAPSITLDAAFTDVVVVGYKGSATPYGSMRMGRLDLSSDAAITAGAWTHSVNKTSTYLVADFAVMSGIPQSPAKLIVAATAIPLPEITTLSPDATVTAAIVIGTAAVPFPAALPDVVISADVVAAPGAGFKVTGSYAWDADTGTAYANTGGSVAHETGTVRTGAGSLKWTSSGGWGNWYPASLAESKTNIKVPRGIDFKIRVWGKASNTTPTWYLTGTVQSDLMGSQGTLTNWGSITPQALNMSTWTLLEYVGRHSYTTYDDMYVVPLYQCNVQQTNGDVAYFDDFEVLVSGIPTPTVSADSTVVAIPIIAGVGAITTTQDFETDIGTAGARAASCDLSWSADVAQSGTHSLKVNTHNGSSPSFYFMGGTTPTRTQGIAVTPGMPVAATVAARRDAASSATLPLRVTYNWYPSAGNILSSIAGTEHSLSATSWTDLTNSSRAPANAAWLVVGMDGTSFQANTNPFYFDDLVISVGPSGTIPQPTVSADSTVVASTVTAGIGITVTDTFESDIGTAWCDSAKGALSQSSDVAHAGSYSMKVIGVVGQNPYVRMYGGATPTANQGVAVVAGEQITATAFMQRHPSASGQTWALWVYYYTSGGSIVDNRQLAVATPSTSGWTTFQATDTVPATAAWVIPVLWSTGGAIGTTDPYYIDDVSIARSFVGQIPTPLVQGHVNISATPVAAGVHSVVSFDYESSLGDASATDATLSLSTDQAHSGTQSMKIVPTPGAAPVVYPWGSLDSGGVPVTAGTSVTMSAYMRQDPAQVAKSWYLYYRFLSAANTAVLQTSIDIKQPSSSSWTLLTGSRSVPSGATHMYVFLAAANGTGITADPLYADDISIALGGDGQIPLPTVTTESPDATVSASAVVALAAVIAPTPSASTLVVAVPIIAGMPSSVTTIDFESGLGSASATAATLAQSTDYAQSGTHSMKITPTGGVTAYAYILGTGIAAAIPWTAGTRVAFTSSVRRDAAQAAVNWTPVIRWLNAGGGNAYTWSGAAAVPSSTDWTQIGTTPNGLVSPATGAYVIVYLQGNSGVNANPVYVDDVIITLGGSGQIPLPTVATDSTVAASAVTAAVAIPLPTVTTEVPDATIPAEVITAASAIPLPDGIPNYVTAATVTANQSRVYSFDSTVGSATSNNDTLTIDTTNQFSGIGCLKAVATGAGGRYIELSNTTTDLVPVSAVDTLVLRYYAKGDAATAAVAWGEKISWYTSGKTFISSSSVANHGMTTSYVRYSQNVTRPSNAAYALITIQSGSGGGAGATLYVDNVQLSSVAVPAPTFQMGSSVAGTSVVGTSQIPLPTVTTEVPDATVTADVVPTTATVPLPDGIPNYVTAALVVPPAATVPLPTFQTSSTIAAALVTGAASVQAPTGIPNTVTATRVQSVAAIALPTGIPNTVTATCVQAVTAIALPTFSTSNTITATQVIATAAQPWAVPTVFVYPNRVIAVSGIQQPASLVVPTPPAIAAVASVRPFILSPGPLRVMATTAIQTPIFPATVSPDVVGALGPLVDRTLVSSPFYGWWSDNIYDIKWSPLLNKVVAIAQMVATSDDGLTWDHQSWIAPTTHQWGLSLTETSTALWAVTDMPSIVTSTDGSTWTEYQSSGLLGYGNPIKLIWVEDLGLFVLVVQHAVLTSPDGTTWNVQKSSTDYWTDVAWSPELQLLVLINNGYENTIWTSPNGADWTYRPSGADNWTATQVVWSEVLQLFVVLDYWQGVLWHSSNGIDWYSTASPLGNYPGSICDTPYGVAMAEWSYNSGVGGYLARTFLVRGQTLTPDPVVSVVLNGSPGGSNVVSYIPSSDILAIGGSSSWYVTRNLGTIRAEVPAVALSISADVVASSVNATAGIALPTVTGGGATTVTATFELWESGSFIATLGTQDIVQSDGNTLVAWDLQPYLYLLADQTGAGIELRITAPSDLRIESAEWDSLYEDTGTVDVSFTPGVVRAYAAVPAATPSASLAFTVTLVTATAALALPTFLAVVQLQPVPATATAAVPAPTPSAGLVLAAELITVTVAAPTADAGAGQTAFPLAVLAPGATIFVPTVTAIQNVSITAVTVPAVAGQPSPTEATGSTVTQPTTPTTVTVPLPTITYSTTIVAVAVPTVAATPAATAGAGQTVPAVPATSTAAVPTVAQVSVGSTLVAVLVTATSSVLAPTSVTAIQNVNISAALIITAAGQPSPEESTGSTITSPSSVVGAAGVPTSFPSASLIFTAVLVTATSTVPLPDLGVGVNLVPATVLASSAVALPTFQYGNSVPAVTVAAVAALPVLTLVSANSTVVAVLIPAVATQTRPAFHVSITATLIAPPAVTIPLPTLSTGATPAPNQITATSTVPAFTTSASSTVVAVCVLGTAAVPAPTPAASISFTAALITTIGDQPSPLESAGSTIVQPVTHAIATIPLPTIVYGNTVPAATAAAIASVPTATAAASITITADLVAPPVVGVGLPVIIPNPQPVAVSAAVPPPTIATDGSIITVAVAATTAIGTPDLAIGAVVSVHAVAAVPAPTAHASVLVLWPVTVSATAGVALPTLTIDTNVLAARVITSATVPTAEIMTTAAIVATVVPAVASVLRPGLDATVGAPAVVTATAAVPDPVVSRHVAVVAVSVVAVSAIPLPTILAVTTVSPAAVAAVAIVPTPASLSASSVVTVVAVPVIAGQPSPSEATGSTITQPVIPVPGAVIPLPTLVITATVTATAVAIVATVLRPVFNASIVAAPINALGTLPAPTPSASSLFTAALVTAPGAAVPLPTFSMGATPTPVAITATGAVPAPALTASSHVLAVSVAAIANQPSPEQSAGSLIVVSRIAVVAATFLPSIATGSTVSDALVHGYAAVPLPALLTGMTVASGYVATIVSFPLPTVTADGSVPPVTVLVTSTVPLPTIRTDQYLIAATIVAIAALPTEAASAHENIAVTQVVATAAVGLPTLVTESRFTAPLVAAPGAAFPPFAFSSSVEIPRIAWNDVVLAYASVPAPVVRQDATTAPATITAVAAPHAPTVSASSLVFQLPSTTVAAVAAVPAPTPSAGVRITAARVITTTTIPMPSISAGSSTAVSPSRVTATATVPLPTVRTSALFSVSTIAVTTHVPTASLQTSSMASPATLALHTHFEWHVLSASILMAPDTVDTVGAVGSVTVRTGMSVATTTIPALAYVNSVAEVSVGSTLTLDWIRLNASIEPFTVTLAGDIIPNPVNIYAYVGTSKIIIAYPEGWGFLI